MVKITLYTTGCPKCSILKKKLEMAHLNFDVCRDSETMIQKGLESAPGLEVDGVMLNFSEAVQWVKKNFSSQS